MINKSFLLLIITTGFFSLNCFGQSGMSEKKLLPALYNENGDNFTVIAHRGASAYYPENTMAAFHGAVEMDSEMIELDVMLSKDGVPVVFHDARLDDHTNGTGPLKYYNLNQLKELDAGSWFSEEFSGERIPTLEEVLAFASGKIALNIEIKTEAVSDQIQNGVEEKCMALVKEYDMEDHVLFSSFDYRAVKHLKELDSDMPVALLYNKRYSGRMLPNGLVKEYNADAFNCSYRQLTKKRLADLRNHEIPFFIYTVDERKKMETLLHLGTSGIFTNKPDLLNEVVEDVAKQR